MFVQQEVHRRDIDAVVMGRNMTSCLLTMFVRRASRGASRQQRRLFCVQNTAFKAAPQLCRRHHQFTHAIL